jgi:hypothetical protein
VRIVGTIRRAAALVVERGVTPRNHARGCLLQLDSHRVDARASPAVPEAYSDVYHPAHEQYPR